MVHRISKVCVRTQKETRRKHRRKQKKSDQEQEQEITKLVTHYFRLLCFDYKVISVEYFLNKMTLSELPIILQQLQYTDRSIWETTRLQCLIYAQKNCKKKLTATDIFSLPWDNNRELTTTDISELRAHKDELEALVNAHAQTHKTE